jgi:hypothetical protein
LLLVTIVMLTVFGASATGCVDAESIARTRAANDFECDEDKVNVTNIGGTSFRADGCGQKGVYTCTASEGYSGTTTDYACVPEAKRAHGKKASESEK